MSEMPRFENVDLTPTWDDVDPAALDFGVGAMDVGVDVDAGELDPQPLPAQSEPEPEAEPVPVDEPEAEVEGFEPPAVQDVPVEDAPDDGAYWESSDQFDGGEIVAESVPDDFDDLT